MCCILSGYGLVLWLWVRKSRHKLQVCLLWNCVQFVYFAPFVTLFGFCSCGSDRVLSLSLFFISPLAGSFVFMELVRISGFHQYEVSWAAPFLFPAWFAANIYNHELQHCSPLHQNGLEGFRNDYHKHYEHNKKGIRFSTIWFQG